MPDPLPAAGLTRVSTAGQARDGTSLQSQDETVREFAAAHGLTVIEVIADDHTGRTRDRPGLRRLRELVAARAIAAVIIPKIDRLARRAHLGIATERWLLDQGVRVLYTDLPVDLSTPVGRYISTSFHGVSELVSDLIRENTSKGRRKIARGRGAMPIGFAPYGYHQITRAQSAVLVEYAGRSGELVVMEEEAEVVRQVFALCAAGHSLSGIARLLNEQGRTTRAGNPWRVCSVRVMLRNSTYRGDRHYGQQEARQQEELTEHGNPRVTRRTRPPEEWIHLPVPALVSPALWHAAQARLEENRLRHTGPPSGRWPLRGVIACGKCTTATGRGRAFAGNFSRKSTGAEYREYRCTSRCDRTLQQPPCGVRIPALRVEAMAWRALEEAARPGVLAERLVAEATREHARHGAPAEALAAAAAELEAVDAAEEQLYELASRGFSEALVERKLALLKERRRRAQDALEAARVRVAGPSTPSAVGRAAERAALELAAALPLAREDAALLSRLYRLYLRVIVHSSTRATVRYRLPVE